MFWLGRLVVSLFGRFFWHLESVGGPLDLLLVPIFVEANLGPALV